METQDKVVILEGLSAVSVHEEWTPLSVNGQRPKPRYEVCHMHLGPWLPCLFYFYFLSCELLSQFSPSSVHSINMNFYSCSMAQLWCKIRCIYLGETTMGVTLATFRYVKLNITVKQVACGPPKYFLSWTWRHMSSCHSAVCHRIVLKCLYLLDMLSG